MNEYLVSSMGMEIKVRAARAAVALSRGVDAISVYAKKADAPGADARSKNAAGLWASVKFLHRVAKGEK